ncbi:hypothetical protein LINPERHAP1_LOCUS8053 [Linum perenne]
MTRGKAKVKKATKKSETLRRLLVQLLHSLLPDRDPESISNAGRRRISFVIISSSFSQLQVFNKSWIEVG